MKKILQQLLIISFLLSNDSISAMVTVNSERNGIHIHYGERKVEDIYINVSKLKDFRNESLKYTSSINHIYNNGLETVAKVSSDCTIKTQEWIITAEKIYGINVIELFKTHCENILEYKSYISSEDLIQSYGIVKDEILEQQNKIENDMKNHREALRNMQNFVYRLQPLIFEKRDIDIDPIIMTY